MKNRQQVLKYLYNGYFDGSNLPPYYRARGFESFNFVAFKDKATRPSYTRPIHYYAPKAKAKLREFTLINPYSYWQIANTLAGDGFELVANKLNVETKVNSYGLLASTGDSFRAWEQGMEIDLPSHSSLYSFLAVTDISNCYKSIYTHSLSWALHDKGYIKDGRNRHDLSLVGNRIDCVFQSAMDEQTNGLPVGNAASHLAAELIFKDVDERLSNALGALDFVGFRFRDDYRFLTKTKDAAKKIIRTLDQILQTNYGMHLNDSKTDFFDDIIGNCYRPWKAAVRDNALLSKIDQLKTADDLQTLIEQYQLEGIFLSVYQAQKVTPYRLAPALLEKVARYLRPEHLRECVDRVYAIESILESIVDLKEESVIPFAKIISIVTKSLVLPSTKQQFLKHVARPERLDALSEQQATWIYRMLMVFGHENLVGRDHPLIKVLDSEEYDCDSSLFITSNLAVHEELHHKFTMINRELLESLRKKEIGKQERNVFYNTEL